MMIKLCPTSLPQKCSSMHDLNRQSGPAGSIFQLNQAARISRYNDLCACAANIGDLSLQELHRVAIVVML